MQKKIGETLFYVADYIDQLEPEDIFEKKISSDAVPKILGFSSWARVKKNVNFVALVKGVRIGREDSDTKIIIVSPMRPTGRGYQYLGEKDFVQYACVDNSASIIGQAVLDALVAFDE